MDGTAAQISAARHVWEEDVQTYRTCTSVQQALKKQIIGVFEPMYLEILNDNMVGYANISARDMVDHLFETYGNITKTHIVYAVVVDQGQLYTDLTGKFPV
jgi:hypothetical protein